MNKNKILLSILIPTVVGREVELGKLLHKIQMVYGNIVWKKEVTYAGNLEWGLCFADCPIEIYYLKDDKSITIGEKREAMYKPCSGKFAWQIDDDDDISNNAIELILEAIKSNPEIPCITFKEKCIINGEYKSSNHSILYSQWMDNSDGYDYVRCPFYKDVIRTDLAKSIPFERIRYNEDERWSMAIKHLLTDELHIEEELYYYFYEPKESHNERYGIKD